MTINKNLKNKISKKLLLEIKISLLVVVGWSILILLIVLEIYSHDDLLIIIIMSGKIFVEILGY